MLSAIAREFDGRPVYAQPLKPTVCAPPVALAGQVAGWGDVGGLRVYTIYSVASRALRHGSAFGCDVEFWAPTADGGLRAVRPTLLGRELPREAMRPAKLTVGERSHPTYEPFTRPFVDDITFPIDVVYTWVDGADPGWRARRDETLTGRSAAAEAVTTAADRGDGRYASRDELRYSLRSLDMYAPWVRHIWIVTDQQVPSWLDTSHPKVTVVDHKEIFSDARALPTFNSHAIESRLHVIPGLSENFIYFNDDFFVGRPLSPDLFFLPSGIPLFFRSPATVLPTPIQEDEKSFYAAAKTTRDIMEREFGCTTANTFLHAPYALRKSVLFELAERFAPEIAATGRSRVRSREDVSVVSSLHHYHAFRSGKAVPGEISVDYIALGQRDHLPRLTRLLTLRDRDAFCVNDADESDMSEEENAVRSPSSWRATSRSPVNSRSAAHESVSTLSGHIDFAIGRAVLMEARPGLGKESATEGQARSWRIPKRGILSATEWTPSTGGLSLKAPLLSVVVPFYNVVGYIEECLTSLAAQTLMDVEFILVDDGSMDGGDVTAKEFAARDSRFRVLRQDNQGPGPARNLGIRHATGLYLAFADGDDVVPETAYELLVGSLEETGSTSPAAGCAGSPPRGSSRPRCTPSCSGNRHGGPT